MQYEPPKCLQCARLQDVEVDSPEGGLVPTCDAFPAGIPTDIYYRAKPHDKPVPGDNGLTFKAK